MKGYYFLKLFSSRHLIFIGLWYFSSSVRLTAKICFPYSVSEFEKRKGNSVNVSQTFGFLTNLNFDHKR